MALKTVLRTLLKLFAPILPYVTDAIFTALFAAEEGVCSIHAARWPEAGEFTGRRAEDEALGEVMISIATAARRFKSEHALSLGTEIARLHAAVEDAALADRLQACVPDLLSVTRARSITLSAALETGLVRVACDRPGLAIGVEP